jgi:plasmid stabilization system protein ParE
MTPQFHPAARLEIAAALKVGEARGFDLGRELLQEVRRVTALLCETPSIGERLDNRHRRFPLRKFPFGLIFRVDGELLTIIAVAHRRQKPGYWRGRT